MATTHDERVANAEAWVLGGGVDAGPTTLEPNHGPVWVEWHASSYSVWTERFPTASHAAEEMRRRTMDSYYPTWDDVSAYIFGCDPAENDGAYPLAELTLTDDGEYGYTVALTEC